jgi:hypothetical protein
MVPGKASRDTEELAWRPDGGNVTRSPRASLLRPRRLLPVHAAHLTRAVTVSLVLAGRRECSSKRTDANRRQINGAADAPTSTAPDAALDP